jgi:hypothetical protein
METAAIKVAGRLLIACQRFLVSGVIAPDRQLNGSVKTAG